MAFINDLSELYAEIFAKTSDGLRIRLVITCTDNPYLSIQEILDEKLLSPEDIEEIRRTFPTWELRRERLATHCRKICEQTTRKPL